MLMFVIAEYFYTSYLKSVNVKINKLIHFYITDDFNIFQ